MTEFLAIVAILVGIAIVAYVKFPDFKNLVDDKLLKRFKKPVEASEDVLATPVATTPEKSIVEAVKPVSADDFGPGPDTFVPLTPEPQNQEEWDEYRQSFIPSTRAYIKPKFEPNSPDTKAILINQAAPRYLPAHWDGKPFRMIAKLDKGVTRISFEDDGKDHELATCAATSIKAVVPSFALVNANGEVVQGGRSDSASFKFGPKRKAKTAPGVNVIEITVKDSGGLWVRIR